MLLSADNLHFGFNGGSLLEKVTFSLNEGDRVGLIGGNGEGKTTLLKLILGKLQRYFVAKMRITKINAIATALGIIASPIHQRSA